MDKHPMNGVIIKDKANNSHVNNVNNNELIAVKLTAFSGFNEFYTEEPKPQRNKPGNPSLKTVLTFLSNGNCLHLIYEYIFNFQKVIIILFPLKQNLKRK